jgi:hypothetical protein
MDSKAKVEYQVGLLDPASLDIGRIKINGDKAVVDAVKAILEVASKKQAIFIKKVEDDEDVWKRIQKVIKDGKKPKKGFVETELF